MAHDHYYKSVRDPSVHFPKSGPLHFWIGWHQAHGWVLLNYLQFGNWKRHPEEHVRSKAVKLGEFADAPLPIHHPTFQILSTGACFTVPFSEWQAPQFTWYPKHFAKPQFAAERPKREAELDSIIQEWATREHARIDHAERTLAIRERVLRDINGADQGFRIARAAQRAHVVRSPKVLDVLNAALVQAWGRNPRYAHRNRENPEQSHLRLSSARSAELAAMDIYQELYGVARDRSIEQLEQRPGQTGVWQVADIEVQGRLIDVKNTRWFSKDRGKYKNCLVASFKQDYRGRNVSICGMLSPYFEDNSGIQEVIWLGETSLNVLDRLRSEFESNTLCIDFGESSLDGNTLLPPWTFEYPTVFYESSDAAIKSLEAAYGSAPRIVDVPPVVQSESSQAVDECASELQVEQHHLCQMRAREPISRPRLYLHVMSRFVQSLTGGEPFRATELLELLYWPDRSPLAVAAAIAKRSARKCEPVGPVEENFGCCFRGDSPLGLYDPLYTCMSLLRILNRLQHSGSERVREFKMYKLIGPRILHASRDGRAWWTVVAYCWKCKREPLILGENATCEQCLGLRCDCGECRCRSTAAAQSDVPEHE